MIRGLVQVFVQLLKYPYYMPDKKLKLLIADDHRMFIEGLQLMLKHELQMEIAAFALNGKEAIDMMQVYKMRMMHTYKIIVIEQFFKFELIVAHQRYLLCATASALSILASSSGSTGF